MVRWLRHQPDYSRSQRWG